MLYKVYCIIISEARTHAHTHTHTHTHYLFDHCGLVGVDLGLLGFGSVVGVPGGLYHFGLLSTEVESWWRKEIRGNELGNSCVKT